MKYQLIFLLNTSFYDFEELYIHSLKHCKFLLDERTYVLNGISNTGIDSSTLASIIPAKSTASPFSLHLYKHNLAAECVPEL